MPKVKHSHEDLFSIALSLSGLLKRHGGVLEVATACEHFEIERPALRKLLSTMFTIEALGSSEYFFDYDLDSFDEEDLIRSISDGAVSDPPRLSTRQIAALAMGLEYLSSFPEFDNDEDIDALLKVLGSSPQRPGPATGNQIDRLTPIREAMIQKQQIEVEYINQRGESAVRTLEPLRIDLVDGNQYLRAWCNKNLEVRSFRIDRMRNVEITEASFSKEALEAEPSDDILGVDPGKNLVTISATTDALGIFRNFSTSKAPEKIGENWQGEIRVGQLDTLARHIIRWGGRVEVIAPATARNVVLAAARVALGEKVDENLEHPED